MGGRRVAGRRVAGRPTRPLDFVNFDFGIKKMTVTQLLLTVGYRLPCQNCH